MNASVTMSRDATMRGVPGRTRDPALDPDPAYAKAAYRSWAAGMMEFNGSVVRAKHGVRITIQANLAQGNEVLERLRNIVGGTVSSPPSCDGKVRWTLTGSRVADMLVALRKYLSAARVREIETKLNGPKTEEA